MSGARSARPMPKHSWHPACMLPDSGYGVASAFAIGTRRVRSNWRRYSSSAGFDIVATHGTAQAWLKKAVRRLPPREQGAGGRPHIVDMIKNDEISLIVNTTEGKQAIQESHSIRAEAVRQKCHVLHDVGGGDATCTAIEHLDDSDVNRLQDLHGEVAA